ncbi:MAG: hypothetical protein RLZZ241_1412 [Bacteroidota bacterium]
MFLCTICFGATSGLLRAQQPVGVPDHQPWNRLLEQYVSETGEVAYKAMGEELDVLNSYIGHLESFSPDVTWPKNRFLAFFINLYNAGTVRLILENYPLKSIRDLPDPWGRKIFNLYGERLSLDEIEHKILRSLQDPRIHFAINCASLSCPKLNRKAYTEIGLEKELNDAVNSIFTNEKMFQNKKNGLYLSSIFKWYRQDFETDYGSIIDFLNHYHDGPIKDNVRIRFLPYNWELNQKL